MRRLREEGRGQEESEAGDVATGGGVVEEGPVPAVSARGFGALGEEVTVGVVGGWVCEWGGVGVRDFGKSR